MPKHFEFNPFSPGLFDLVNDDDFFAADFGDGAATTYVIAHNLNTLDVEVAFRRNTVPRTAVLVAWEALTVNSIQVSPSNPPAVNELRAIIKAAA